MTENEAIEWLAEETSPTLIHIAEMKKENPMEYINEAVKVACDALEEIQQYREIGSVEQLKKMFDGFWKLKDLCEECEKYGLPEDYWKLNEMCKEYSAIGTIEEFKYLKEKNTEVLLKDGQLLYQQGLLDGYIKAIDEFAKRIKDVYPFTVLELEQLEEIAEQMKGGE